MQSEKVWFLYGAIAMAKGSEVGRRVKLLAEFGPRAQFGAAQSGGRMESRVWERDKGR